MSWSTQGLAVAVTVLLLVSLLVGAAAAQTHGNETSEEEEDGLLSSIQELISELSEFNSNYEDRVGNTFTEALTDVFFGPFEYIVIHLIPELVQLLSYTPAIHGNEAVEEIHGQALMVAYLMAGVGFVFAGILYMVGPLFGVSFREARKVIPRIVVALLFGTFALPLLQIGIDFANALTWAFQPGDLAMEMDQLLGVSVGLVLVAVMKGVLLLVLVIMYMLRNVFLLFIPAIAPLIALFWAFPRSKKYADSFIGLFWALLAMGPLNMIALNFMLEMMSMSMESPLQSVSNWIYGVTALSLMIVLPYQLYGVSQAVAGPATAFAGAAVQTVSKRVQRREQDLKNSRYATRRKGRQRGLNRRYSREEVEKFGEIARENERRDVKKEYEQRVRKPEVKPHEWAEQDPDQTDLKDFDEKGRRILWDGGR